MAKNKVIAGDYTGCLVSLVMGQMYISVSFNNTVPINKDTVECYGVITDEQRKSAASGIMRGAVGAALLGPVGLLAAISAKNKGTYNIAIKFRNGKNSLVEFDDKMYKALMKKMF